MPVAGARDDVIDGDPARYEVTNCDREALAFSQVTSRCQSAPESPAEPYGMSLARFTQRLLWLVDQPQRPRSTTRARCARCIGHDEQSQSRRPAGVLYEGKLGGRRPSWWHERSPGRDAGSQRHPAGQLNSRGPRGWIRRRVVLGTATAADLWSRQEQPSRGKPH